MWGYGGGELLASFRALRIATAEVPPNGEPFVFASIYEQLRK